MKRYVLALDQGTTSSRAILFDKAGKIVSMAQKEFKQYYPKPGWVEQDPMEIWGSQSGVVKEALETAGIDYGEIDSIGITNQRETTVVWDRKSGKPVYNAIVWQCKRTASICETLAEEGYAEYIRSKTGLLLDAYFSGTKIKWILDNVEGARERAERGELLFGTIDTWLIWNLTRGKVHATDVSNASRTMLFDIKNLTWDEGLLHALDIPVSMLPEIVDSSGIAGYGDPMLFGGERIPISGIAGDQQAALFGQGCFRMGMAKNTYGTGCFMLMNTGEKIVESDKGLLTTVAWRKNGRTLYALEGSVFMAGAIVQWLRDEMRLIDSLSESEQAALKVADNGGVYLVPAFVGLGAPHWDMYARGIIVGLTRGSGRDHIIRSALESIAYQTKDVLEAMQSDSGVILKELRVDGGAVENGFLMQFQADILGKNVVKPVINEATAFGAAALAGLATGFWESEEAIEGMLRAERLYYPEMEKVNAENFYRGWTRAVERSKRWEEM
ncbi:MAG: glycerol kinase GlpK [Peptostreptococcaceae bacterium]|nr:glycerol kinase GlpK [Peptostreptococcaceae bacterium]